MAAWWVIPYAVRDGWSCDVEGRKNIKDLKYSQIRQTGFYYFAYRKYAAITNKSLVNSKSSHINRQYR